MDNYSNENIKITLVSLGCSKNLIDCENMSTELKKAGYDVINDVIGSDIVVINTCGFIESAKKKLSIRSWRLPITRCRTEMSKRSLSPDAFLKDIRKTF